MPLVRPDDWCPVGINDLEPRAWDVARSAVNYLVIAGPGAGKTELLAQRACYLLQTGQSPMPHRILAISYKRDAASNLRARVRERCGSELAIRFDSFTFDSFAKGLLDRFRKSLPARWIPTADYTIHNPSRAEMRYFLEDLQTATAAHEHGLDSASMPRSDRFMIEDITGRRLSSEPDDPTNPREATASAWWFNALRGVNGRSQLAFPMIERLIELLLRTNPLIVSALRATYSHVFMDEFQDTTQVQYDIVTTAFRGSSTVVTAVGDNKQRIMAWAGALDSILPRFEEDFVAKRVSLISNYRSSPRLVKIQHAIASVIDEAYVPVESKVESSSETTSCEIREYESTESEANDIAQLIHSLVGDGLQPRDIALLVRQRPQDYEEAIADALIQCDIRMRVETELQDVLAERLTQVVLPHLRLGSVERSGKDWQRCQDIATVLWNADPEEDGKWLVDSLASLHKDLRAKMQMPARDEIETRVILRTILDYLGRDRIMQSYGEYRQGNHQMTIENQLIGFLTGSCRRSASWAEALDDFEGLHYIPMMTIHKSKGLEYEVVIFVGLDDQAWWSFRQQPEEGRSTFFVAFSRAKQQVLFTYCESRGGKAGISSLYDILTGAGVKSITVR